MESESSLLCSQKTAGGFYIEPDKSTSYPHTHPILYFPLMSMSSNFTFHLHFLNKFCIFLHVDPLLGNDVKQKSW
jgi:hypothetical protein